MSALKLPLLAISCLSLLAFSCEQKEGPAEKIGKEIDKAAEEIKEEIKELDEQLEKERREQEMGEQPPL